jgi:hypothetical protein
MNEIERDDGELANEMTTAPINFGKQNFSALSHSSIA